MKKKVLFVQKAVVNYSGGQLITNRNLRILEGCFGKEHVIKFQVKLKSKVTILLQTLVGRMGGISGRDEIEILNLIRRNEIDIVFIDTSLFGKLVKKIKSVYPQVLIFTFFHNVESEYFQSLMAKTKKIYHLFSVKSAALNERLACFYSDFIITMNNRDSDLLQKLWQRRSDILWPTSFEDQYDSSKEMPVDQASRLNLLFVGGRFFANEEAVLWFAKEVCPFLKNSTFYVVGRGFEDLHISWLPDNVKIIGTVDDLDAYYYNADIVVSPIFSGGGMKTKTGEALMYGKFIAGTSEAFEGYEIDHNKVGRICNTADEFISYINTFDRKESKVNGYSRTFFKNNYSTQTLLIQFKTFLNEAM